MKATNSTFKIFAIRAQIIQANMVAMILQNGWLGKQDVGI